MASVIEKTIRKAVTPAIQAVASINHARLPRDWQRRRQMLRLRFVLAGQPRRPLLAQHRRTLQPLKILLVPPTVQPAVHAVAKLVRPL